MVLPRGITGFCSVKDPPLPTFAAHDFTTIGYAVARELGAAVIERDVQPRYLQSYRVLVLQARSACWSLLGHMIHPVIASVAGSVRTDGRVFVDLPALASAAPDFGVTVYPATFLNHAVDPRWLINLPAVEMRQIQYWRPQRMGDLIFNDWD